MSSKKGSVVTIQLIARGLDKKDTFGSSDPYFVICRRISGEEEDFEIVYESEVIKDTVNPMWKPFSIR